MRIGLLGGTFNPIHYGHLILAEECRKNFHLQKIVFIPSAVPPHKGRRITCPKHRYNMVKLAVQNNKRFAIADIELERKGPSFSWETIQYFTRRHPKDPIYFILGIDSLLKIDAWKGKRKVLDLCNFIAATRPGYRIKDIPSSIRKKIKLIKIPGVDISSSQIRKRVKAGKSIKYLLPPKIEEYIYKYRLYK